MAVIRVSCPSERSEVGEVACSFGAEGANQIPLAFAYR